MYPVDYIFYAMRTIAREKIIAEKFLNTCSHAQYLKEIEQVFILPWK